MESRGRHRVTNEEPEANKADGWRNSIYEAYTRNWPGRREVRNFLKIETAP